MFSNDTLKHPYLSRLSSLYTNVDSGEDEDNRESICVGVIEYLLLFSEFRGRHVIRLRRKRNTKMFSFFYILRNQKSISSDSVCSSPSILSYYFGVA